MSLFRHILRWSEKLTVRVTAYVAVTSIAFATVAVLTNLREGRDVLLQRQVERLDDLGSFVAELAASHVDELRAFELKIIIEDAARQRDVTLAQIVDANGSIIARGTDDTKLLLGKSNSEVVARALATKAKVVQRHSDVLDAATPVKIGERLVGAVHIKMSLSSVQAAVESLTRRYLLWGAVLIGLAIPLSALLVGRATRQIRRVTGAVRRIAEGDLDFDFAGTAAGEVGELQGAFGHMRAVLKDNLAEIERLAYTDAVTGLPNRQAFRRIVERVLKSDVPRFPGAVLFVDLDRFKKVNDTFGHHMGDGLLEAVSARLQNLLEEYRASLASPVLARQGGDEFTVLLPHVGSAKRAQVVAERIIEALSRAFMIEGKEIFVGASVGIALYPDHAADHDKLLRNADLAMYAAKDGGRGTLRFYSAELEQLTLERLTIEGELRKALKNDELTVFYQPKVSCTDGRIVGAEALVRWNHPWRGLLTPAAFLSVAEEAGLIADLSWYVLERAVTEATRFAQGERPISLAVNVSATQFDQVDFAERVTAILDRSRLPPALLQLEFTESVAMRDPESVIKRVAPLRERGVRFAIDDFGTGYSSLSYLTRLPIDTVKIDRSFVQAVRNSANDRALVTMILRMAESLKLETVAEGIETEEDFDFVREHGATIAQGFLFSPPMRLADFLILCANFRHRGRTDGEQRPQLRRA